MEHVHPVTYIIDELKQDDPIMKNNKRYLITDVDCFKNSDKNKFKMTRYSTQEDVNMFNVF